MTVLIEKIRETPRVQLVSISQWQPATGFRHRLLAVASLFLVAMLVPAGWGLAAASMSEAYTAVAVFVSATLIVIMAAERMMGGSLGDLLQGHRRWQVPAGALLGALPGCGGAIVAVTQFTRGTMSFGGVVATLTSTMGDAMFLLLAREPLSAFTVLSVSMLAGIVTGYLVDALHGQRFMQAAQQTEAETVNSSRINTSLSVMERLWFVLLVPGLVIGILLAFQVEPGDMPAEEIGLIGALLALTMWLWRGGNMRACNNGACRLQSAAAKVVDDTNFVTAWVIFAFVGFELFMAISGADLANMFSVWVPLIPLIAIIAGFVPGCGPQIIVTSMYLNGSIPFSAQLGNAISNDGDALFPAIAVAPRAAALATLYSAIPAVAVAYGWWWVFE